MLNVSLIQLEYVVALDKHRHFVKAAEACFVTQPTLSMQIKKLEDELGVKIFDRTRHPIIPTDVGEMIITQARTILREKERIINMLNDYKGSVKGTLHIGIIPTISSCLMPYLISNISKTYPDLRLVIKESFTEQIISDLQNDYLDVGILATPLHNSEMVEKPLFYERFYIYMNPSHPGYKEEEVTVDILKQDRLWLLSEGHCFRNQSVELCSINSPGKGLNLEYESGSLETLKKLVDIEGGATVLPEWATYELCDNSTHNLRHMKNEHTIREIGLVYTRNFAKAKLIAALEECIDLSTPDELKKNQPNETFQVMDPKVSNA